MKIVLIGSGNVATQMGLSIRALGENIVQVYSQNIKNAIQLAGQVDAVPVTDYKKISREADLYIISIKDDAIAHAAEALKGVDGLVVHTAGTVDLTVLSAQVKNAGVFYPLQTFSKTRPVNFKTVPLCIEATDKTQLEVLKKMAQRLSQQVYELNGEKRKALHLAAVFACNFTNHLYALSNQILEKNHIDFEIIRPLIIETAEKIAHNLPENVQTGPAVRGDEETINTHLTALKRMPELYNIYQTLSNSIKKTYK